MVDHFLTTLDCVDHAFVADDTFEQLPAPAYLVLQRYLSPEAVLTTWKQAYNRSVYRGDGPFV